MLKMIDVLEKNLVQNLTHAVSLPSTQLDEQWNQSILATSEHDLQTLMSAFFTQTDAVATAQALDISIEAIQALQAGLALKADYLIDTAKIIALHLALETKTLNQLEVPDCLQDYPI